MSLFTTARSAVGVVTLWYFIGMTAGGFFGGVISDFIGRRKTFLISIATFSFFSVLNGFTDNFHVFVITRSMTGFGEPCITVRGLIASAARLRPASSLLTEKTCTRHWKSFVKAASPRSG